MNDLPDIEGKLVAALAKLNELRASHAEAASAQATRNQKVDHLSYVAGDQYLIDFFVKATDHVDRALQEATNRLQRQTARVIALKKSWFEAKGMDFDDKLQFWSVGGQLYTGNRNDGVGTPAYHNKVRDRPRPS